MNTIRLNNQELNIVAAALGRLPYETVAPVIASIQQQLAAAQMDLAASAAPTSEPAQPPAEPAEAA